MFQEMQVGVGGGGSADDVFSDITNFTTTSFTNPSAWSPASVSIPSGVTYALISVNTSNKGASTDVQLSGIEELARPIDTYSPASQGGNGSIVVVGKVANGATTLGITINTRDYSGQVGFVYM